MLEAVTLLVIFLLEPRFFFYSCASKVEGNLMPLAKYIFMRMLYLTCSRFFSDGTT